MSSPTRTGKRCGSCETTPPQTGVTPTLRRMQTVGGFDIRELFRLFPGKPAKKMAYLAGLPKPVGCV